MTETSASPDIDRPVTLQFMGDWGGANLTRVCGWLMQEFGDRTGAGSRCAIWSGRGGADALHGVAGGSVDVALCTPADFAAMAIEGRGPFAGSAYPDLRALAVIPQDDRMVIAVAGDLAIRTLDDLRHAARPLTVATSPDDGINFVGLAAHALLDAAGIGKDVIRSWGGNFLEDERPFPCIQWFAAGDADVLVQEAIMAPQWATAIQARDARLLAIEPNVIDRLHARFGWSGAMLEAGRLPNLDADLPTLDFRDFLVVVRADMPDDIARLLTWCLTETRSIIELQYAIFPSGRGPIGVPLDPATMAATPIRLHPAARAHYLQSGYLTD